jgi:hypothetical protein
VRGKNKKGKSESRLSSREVTKSKRSREGLDSGQYVHRERKENRIEKKKDLTRIRLSMTKTMRTIA